MPRAAVRALQTRPALRIWASVLGLLALYVVVDYFFARAGYLPRDAYSEGSLLVGWVERVGAVPVVLGAVVFGLLLAFGDLACPWTALSCGVRLRRAVVLLAGLIAWSLSTFGYNHYYDQPYLVERLLIVALVPLIWLRPVFVFPFLLVAYVFFWQIYQPVISAGAHLLHKTHLLHVLSLFSAALLFRAATGYRRMDAFVLLAVCLVGGAYWVPALAKLRIDWLDYGTLHHMPIAAWAHGWLAHLESSDVVALARAIEPFDLPLQLFVLAAELGCIAILARRWLTISLLLALSAFHLGVFALYGYFFWTWIALNLTLLALIASDARERRLDLYGPAQFAVSVLLVGLAGYWWSPSPLAWHDTRLAYTYRYEVTDAAGDRYTLPPRFFEPYGDVFTMANFGYLVDSHGMLVFPYGTSRVAEIATGLASATTAEQIFLLEDTAGRRRYDPVMRERFLEFLARYLTNFNRNGARLESVAALGPPPQFWSTPRGRVYTGTEPVRQIAVFEVTTLFDGETVREIRRIEIARLPIPLPGDAQLAGLPAATAG